MYWPASLTRNRLAPFQPFADAVDDPLEGLAGVLERPPEALAVVLVRLAGLFLRVGVRVAAHVVAADDPVVLARADPVHQLGNATHRVRVCEVELRHKSREPIPRRRPLVEVLSLLEE